jgi:hypothetical protein
MVVSSVRSRCASLATVGGSSIRATTTATTRQAKNIRTITANQIEAPSCYSSSKRR